MNNNNKGRKPVKPHDRRVSCHGLRLKAYWLYWLQKHPRLGGKMIERALAEHYGPDEEGIIDEFYEQEPNEKG